MNNALTSLTLEFEVIQPLRADSTPDRMSCRMATLSITMDNRGEFLQVMEFVVRLYPLHHPGPPYNSARS